MARQCVVAPSEGFPSMHAARWRLQRVARQLEDLGYPVADVQTAAGTQAIMVDRGGERRAAVVPVELGARAELVPALRALREMAPRLLTVLACGPVPEWGTRCALRQAGVELALYEPLGPRDLRFQMNRALAPAFPPPRRAARGPVDVDVTVRWGLRTRPARLYTLSSMGAFLVTDQPLRPGRQLRLEVPVGLLRPRARGRVVMTNEPDDPIHPDLPPGMAVCFRPLDGPSAAVIDRLVAESLQSLAL